MKTIYFVRHSIRDTTIKNEFAPLSDEGQKLALRLVDFFANKQIDAIYSSPFSRAIDTIQPTAIKLNQSIHLLENLKERNVGQWVADFDAFSKQQWLDFDYKLDNGESLNDVRQRIIPVFNDVLKQKFQSSIITGHGTSLSILFHHLTNTDFGHEDFLIMSMPDIFVATFDDDNQLVSFKHEFY